MRRIITLFILIGLPLFFFKYWVDTDINGIVFKNNLHLSDLHQRVEIDSDIVGEKLVSGLEFKQDFRAQFNNLGQVQLQINNYERINSGKLKFRIREKTTSDWYYQNEYDTTGMDVNQYYPFGFAPIQDSGGRTYEISLISTSEDKSNAVSVAQGHFTLVYQYQLSDFKSNISYIPNFILNKLSNVLDLITFRSWMNLLVLSILSGVISFPLLVFIDNVDIQFNRGNKLLRVGLLILLSMYVLTHVQFLNYSQYWDAGNYYTGLKSISKVPIDFKHFFENFNFQGHPSMGYLFLMSIGQIISHDNIFLLNLQNLILALISIVAFCYALLYFFRKRFFEVILMSAIFAFNPLFYATSISFNLDFPVLVFGVVAFSAFLYRRYYLFIFSSILMVFSKEIGILIFLSFLISYILFVVIKTLTKKHKKIDTRLLVSVLLPVALFLLFIYLNNGKLWSNSGSENLKNSDSFVWNDDGYFNFGISSKNITTRIFQIFAMNFNWVISLVIFLGFLKSQIKGVSMLEGYPQKHKDIIRCLIYTFAVTLSFKLVYIVMPFSRYVVDSVFFVLMIFYIALSYLFKHSIKKRVTVLILVLCFFVLQTFKSVDPSVYLFYGKFRMGDNLSSPFFGFADGLVYNSQFANFDILANKITEKYGDRVLVRQDRNEYFFKLIPFKERVGNIEYLYKNEDSDLLFVYFPWFSDLNDDLAMIADYYKSEYIGRIEVAGYYTELYNLIRK